MNMIAMLSYFIAVALVCGLLILLGLYFSLWLPAYLTGTRISLLHLVLMSLGKTNPAPIVQCQVMAVQSGLAKLAISDMEAHCLACGDVRRVTLALMASNRVGSRLNWDTAAELQVDQADADVRVTRPHAEKRRAMAVAKQQKMKARLAQIRAVLLVCWPTPIFQWPWRRLSATGCSTQDACTEKPASGTTRELSLQGRTLPEFTTIDDMEENETSTARNRYQWITTVF